MVMMRVTTSSDSPTIALMRMSDAELVQSRMLFDLVCQLLRTSAEGHVDPIDEGAKNKG